MQTNQRSGLKISLTTFATSIGVASKAIGWLNIQAGALHCLLKQQTQLTLTSWV